MFVVPMNAAKERLAYSTQKEEVASAESLLEEIRDPFVTARREPVGRRARRSSTHQAAVLVAAVPSRSPDRALNPLLSARRRYGRG